MNVLAQIFGAFALLFLVISYQQRKRINFLNLQASANIFYVLQYFVLHAYSGMISFIISTIKMIIFQIDERKNRTTNILVFIILEISFIFFGILTYDGLYSIIPILGACMFTYGAWQRNLKITYFIAIIVAVMSNVYDIAVGAYISVISNVFELVASLIGFRKVCRGIVIKNNFHTVHTVKK